MVCCAIVGCSNHDTQQKESGIRFHRFPKNDHVRLKWINVCKRADSFSADVARVCSVHFEKSDYLRDLKAELLNLPVKFTLKPDAVPHLNLPVCNGNFNQIVLVPNDDRRMRAEKRNAHKEAEEIFETLLNNESNNVENNLTVGEINMEQRKICLCNNEEIQATLESLNKENDMLKSQIRDLKEELNVTNNKLTQYKESVERIFSERQQQVLLKGRCVNWSSEDIAKAVTLRCISIKALAFVKNVLKFPLPSEETVKRRLRQFSISPGFINLSLDILRTQASLFTEIEKDVVLSFDEMKIKNELCFDNVEKMIRGPHNNVQVIVIRSLVGKWMQPIYYNFDTAISKELLMETIQIIEKTGFKVRAFVCDMGPSNRKLMTDLNLSPSESSMKNPSDENRNIWMFCDVPHLLKLLRNHLLDQGYQLPNKQLITKEPLVKLIEIQNMGGDLEYAHKLSMKHILVAGTERQNVRKAAELFSLTVGKAISHLFPEMSHVGEMIETVNNGFDVLNSRIPYCEAYNLKSAYGNCLKEQNEALDKLYNLITSIRIIEKEKPTKKNSEIGKEKKKTSLLPFQKGFLISINSLRGLFKELKSEGLYSYIMASRCNQDVLESYFSQIRGLGRFYDHPLPTTVTQRIKSLIMSRSASEIITTANCIAEKEVQTLSANMISESIEDQIHQTLDITEEEFEVSKHNDYDDVTFEIELDGFFEENELIIHAENEKKELLEKLAGYIVYRVKKKYPEKAGLYGSFTKDVKFSGKNWLQSISRGCLMKPHEPFFETVLKMEEEFCQFHGNDINKCSNVFKALCDKIKSKYSDFDDFVTLTFVRTRTFIRMKSLNKQRSRKTIKRINNEERKK